MFALVSPEKIQLPIGAVVRLPATWQDYQILCQQRGDGSIPRIKYCSGEVLLMSPLPKHGRDASLIADIIKVHEIALHDRMAKILQVPQEVIDEIRRLITPAVNIKPKSLPVPVQVRASF
jgi:Uma2 family endonuclease